MTIHGILHRKRNVAIMVTTLVAVSGLVIAGFVLHSGTSSKEPTVKEFQKNLSLLHEAYMEPVAKTQQLSLIPEASQETFLNHAAEYYGVTSDTGNGAAPAPLEIVGACMRERNIELAQTYAKLPIPDVESNEKAIDQVRVMIAKDCYARYSSDGTVPRYFTEDIHNH